MAARLSEARQALDKLRDSGALWPINKSTEWIERRLNLQFYLCYVIFLYRWAFIFFTLVVPLLIGAYKRLEAIDKQAVGQAACPRWTPSSKLVGTSLVTAIPILVFPASFYRVNSTVTQIDSIQSINVLTTMAKDCRLINYRLLEQVPKVTMGKDARRKVNENLLLIVIQYKIAVSQFGIIIAKSLQFFMGQMMVATLVPIQIFFHKPYIDPLGDDVFISSNRIVYTAPSYVSIYPVCLLYSKCQQLFIGMTRLLAHTVEVNERLGDIYDEHTVSILRKELDNPHQALKRFESSVFGIACTYTTFCNWTFSGWD